MKYEFYMYTALVENKVFYIKCKLFTLSCHSSALVKDNVCIKASERSVSERNVIGVEYTSEISKRVIIRYKFFLMSVKNRNNQNVTEKNTQEHGIYYFVLLCVRPKYIKIELATTKGRNVKHRPFCIHYKHLLQMPMPLLVSKGRLTVKQNATGYWDNNTIPQVQTSVTNINSSVIVQKEYLP